MWDAFWRGILGSGAGGHGAVDPNDVSLVDVFYNIVETVSYVVGFAAVIMIIVGGLMYVFSAGDEKRVATARKMIVGAAVGLGIALLAWTIVNFVLRSL